MENQTLIVPVRMTPVEPLKHGGESNGSNIVPIARQQINVLIDGEWQTVEIPYVSGGALKGILRQIATENYLQILGVEPGSLSKAAVRLLCKGGKLDGSTGGSVSLERMRELYRLFPMLELFGAMDNALTCQGRIAVSDATPHMAATRFKPEHVACYGDEPPIDPSMVVTSRTNYRHDLGGSHLSRYIGATERAQIEDKAAATKAKKAAGAAVAATERRETNDAMPHECEIIVPGTPMAFQFVIHNASPLATMCGLTAFAILAARGGPIGGGGNAGFGRCRLEVCNPRAQHGGRVTPVSVNDVQLPVHQAEYTFDAKKLIEDYHNTILASRESALKELLAIREAP